VGMGMTSVSV